MREEAQGAGADATLAVIAERDSHAAEPPRPVAAAMAAADVVLAPTVQSLSHTAARKAASEAGVRIATLPGVTAEMLARVMGADMAELRRRGRAVAAALDRGEEARITCAHGSDLRLGLEGRTGDPRRRRADRARSLRQPALRRGVRRAAGGDRGGDAGRRRLDRRGRAARRAGHAHRPRRPPDRGHRHSRRHPAGAADRPRPGWDERRRAWDRHQREGDPHRQRPRGREDPRHRPRRLRRLGGDRRHGPGPRPPRLRGAGADRGNRRRGDRPRRRAAHLR